MFFLLFTASASSKFAFTSNHSTLPAQTASLTILSLVVKVDTPGNEYPDKRRSIFFYLEVFYQVSLFIGRF